MTSRAASRELMEWSYERELVVLFEWPSWREGRALTADADAMQQLTPLQALKRLIAVARNDRFHDGAWEGFARDGQLALCSCALERASGG